MRTALLVVLVSVVADIAYVLWVKPDADLAHLCTGPVHNQGPPAPFGVNKLQNQIFLVKLS